MHASAIFGLLGIILGALLTFWTSKFLRTHDYSLLLWEKLVDKRIAAHEAVVNCALQMRVMRGLGRVDANGAPMRIPIVMASANAFEDWFASFTNSQLPVSTWLTTSAKREVNFVQDYLVTLCMNLQGVPGDRYPEIGLIIRQDFIDLSTSLERAGYEFFEQEINRLSLSNLRDWHKYPRHETEERLERTALLQRANEINAIRLR